MSVNTPPFARRIWLSLLLIGCSLAGCSIPSPSPSSPSPSLVSIGLSPSGIAFFDNQAGLLVGAAGSGNGMRAISRTSDGGRSWTTTLMSGLPFSIVTVAGTDRAWAGVECFEGGACDPGIWASTDGGLSWNQISAQLIVSIAFADTTHGWAITLEAPSPGGPIGPPAGVLMRTADAGVTWTAVASPCSPEQGAPVAVSFPDPLHGWVGCSIGGALTAGTGVAATVDGGLTWSSVGPVQAILGLAMRPDGIGMAWSHRGGTSRTNDGGRTWTPMPPGEFDVVDPATGWALTDDDWLLVVFDGNRGQELLESTHDGGSIWEITAILQGG